MGDNKEGEGREKECRKRYKKGKMEYFMRLLRGVEVRVRKEEGGKGIEERKEEKE